MGDQWLTRLAGIRKRRETRKGNGFGRRVEHLRAFRQHRHEATGPWNRRPKLSSFWLCLLIAIVFGLAAPFVLHHAGLLDLRLALTTLTTVNSTPPAAVSRPVPTSLPICAGSRRITCIVDGDTGWHEGEKWRLVSRSGGVDAPEVSRPGCPAEGTAGAHATRRLQVLMSAGYTLSGTDYDRYNRRLVMITLADGRDAGELLIVEGLAQEWPNSGNPWCQR